MTDRRRDPLADTQFRRWAKNVGHASPLAYGYAFTGWKGARDTTATLADPAVLTRDERYWLARRGAIIDAVAANGFEIYANKDRVWLRRVVR